MLENEAFWFLSKSEKKIHMSSSGTIGTKVFALKTLPDKPQKKTGESKEFDNLL